MTLDENPEAGTRLANKDIIAAIHDCEENAYNILINNNNNFNYCIM